ncbi:hypothetical protein ANCDUO_18615 [Ancylostoma duodenale]|uniref:Uncharacterized protein n=1 Tax=Ancylostoma duodenale TaxID=51022 RepID=A0A0C2CNH2_9BILA|nr:hypothetical protein ANCDUO_18615 [Ancylostoma duodenale]
MLKCFHCMQVHFYSSPSVQTDTKRNGECATFYGNKSHLLKNLYVIGFNTIEA